MGERCPSKCAYMEAALDSVSPAGIVRDEPPPHRECGAVCPEHPERLRCRYVGRTATLEIEIVSSL